MWLHFLGTFPRAAIAISCHCAFVSWFPSFRGQLEHVVVALPSVASALDLSYPAHILDVRKRPCGNLSWGMY